MFRIAINFYVFLYLIPLGFVLSGHSVHSYLFYFVMVGSWVLVLIATGFGFEKARDLPPKDYSDYLKAPKFFIVISMLTYLALKAPEMLEAISEFRSGNITAFMLQGAVDRYAGFSSAALRSQLGTCALFCFFCFWGSRFMRPGEGRLNLSAMLFAVLAAVTESLELARAALLLALLCFAVEFCIRNNQRLEKMSAIRYLRLGLYSVVVALIVFVFSAYFRVSTSDNAVLIVLEKLQIYTLASYDLFFVWLDQMPQEGLLFGEQTFAFIWKLFGVEFAQGNYTPMLSTFGYSNIYLNLRGLVMDFGIMGTSVLILLALYLPFICSRSDLTLLRYMIVRCSLAILLFPIYSPFYFTIFAVSFLFSGFCICCAQIWRRKEALRRVERLGLTT